MTKTIETAKTSAKSDEYTALQQSPTMARLIRDLESGSDIGHYGQFVFITAARHFIDDDAITELIAKQPDMTEERANAMVLQISEKGYNPPKREKILDFQKEQDYPIIENPDDPDAGNLYRELHFPETVYEEINHYYEEKAEAAG